MDPNHNVPNNNCSLNAHSIYGINTVVFRVSKTNHEQRHNAVIDGNELFGYRTSDLCHTNGTKRTFYFELSKETIYVSPIYL